MRLPFAIALFAGGCLSIPDYQPETAVSFTANGSGATVAGTSVTDGARHRFALEFAGGEGFHFPEALTIDGVDVMGRDPSSGCFDEDEAGVLIAPTPRISANGDARPVTNRLVPTLRGPAVVQVTLEWSTRLVTCPNTERTPGGTSRFTVFPDGRIVRYDEFSDPSTTAISAYDCACDKNADGASAFTVSTFWALARGDFVDLYTFKQEMLPLPGPNEIAASNQETACLGKSDVQVAFAWRDSFATKVRGDDALISFGRDHLFQDSKLPDYTLNDSLAIFIEHKSCDAALTRAEEHVRPPALQINGDPVAPSALDGIYGGLTSEDQPGIPLATERVELTGTTASSFAVWLRFPRPVDALRATLEGKSGPWYLPQQVDDRSWIVWFPAQISPGQTIVIEPR